MPFSGKPSPYRPAIIGILLITLTMACALGDGSVSEPFFTAPSGQPAWTLTPSSGAAVTPESTPVPDAGLGTGGDAPFSLIGALTLTPAPTEEAPPPGTAPKLLYWTQAGDSLKVVAARFNVEQSEIESQDPIPETAFFPPNQLLIIPNRLLNTTMKTKLLPDSEVVYSPSAINFDIAAFVKEAGGYLSTYTEYLKSTGNTSGANIVARVASENSINPRLLLALLEYQSGWVYGQPHNIAEEDYPLGRLAFDEKGLYHQLVWAVKHISTGYYGWREGQITSITFSDGVSARIAPELNAGSAALQYYFSQLYGTAGWVEAIDINSGLPALHEAMFGNPWIRAQTVEPLYPPGLEQPNLILPFQANVLWSYSGGPHGAWGHEGARAALDFAPGSSESGCVESYAWVVASAPGLVVRSDNGIVILDLDGDGYDQTGWVLFYLHVAAKDRIPIGSWVDTGDRLGHPSCEGGFSTGTHVHFARKYNGEWIPADGPIPFNLNGWIAQAGELPYQGTMTRDGVTIRASVVGSYESRIRRVIENP